MMFITTPLARRSYALLGTEILFRSTYMYYLLPLHLVEKMNREKNMNLSRYKPHYVALTKLGVPIMIGQLGMIVLAITDTMMVGQHSTTELAAASFVNNMFNLAIIFGTGFSYGLTPMVGSLYGQGKLSDIGRSLKNGLLANTVMAVVLTAAMALLYVNIPRLEQPEELLPLIRPYYLILLVSLIFVLLFNAFKQFTDGITDTRTAMWVLLTGNVLNILGNWVLIYGKLGMPEMGLLGAGVATLVSRVLMVGIFVWIFFFTKKYAPYREGFLCKTCNRTDFIQLNKLGIPVGLQMGMETASFNLSTIMVGWLGTLALAAHQVMLTVGQLGFMMYYGMAAAVAVRVSNFHGQHDKESVERTVTAGFHLTVVMATAVSLLIFVARYRIGGWFADNAAVQLMVAQLVVPFVVYQLGDALQCNYSNALRGITDVKPVMYIAFIAYFLISLPSGYLFGFVMHLGLLGIWLSFPLGLTSAGLMFYWRFKMSSRRKL